jgi:DNA-binding response OmpR family regulator
MRRNVLVVDDDPHILELVKFFLDQAGFVVRICKRQSLRLGHLRHIHASNERN